MSCDCSRCQRGKQISTLRALQPEKSRVSVPSKYPKKTSKPYMDRYLAARKNLIHDIERYMEGRRRGIVDSWFYSKVTRKDWYAVKYRKARAECKKRGLL